MKHLSTVHRRRMHELISGAKTFQAKTLATDAAVDHGLMCIASDPVVDINTTS